MRQQDENNQEQCPNTCEDDFLGGLFQLMDKIEEEKTKEDKEKSE